VSPRSTSSSTGIAIRRAASIVNIALPSIRRDFLGS
jgi:hypothetical protein